MDIHIHIEKKHFIVLVALIALVGLFMVASAEDVSEDLPYHYLQQVAKSNSDMTSVDENKNGRIDWADNVSWSGVQSKPAGFADNTDHYLPQNPATSNVDMNNNDIRKTDVISFQNHEWGDRNIDGGVYWDKSAGLYVRSSNAPNSDSNGRLLWSGANVQAGSGIDISYDGEDEPTISASGGSNIQICIECEGREGSGGVKCTTSGWSGWTIPKLDDKTLTTGELKCRIYIDQ